MSLADQQHRILKICPVDVRKGILRDYDPDDFADYETLKQEILDRVTSEMEETGKGLHVVSNQAQKGKKSGSGNQEEEQQQQETVPVAATASAPEQQQAPAAAQPPL